MGQVVLKGINKFYDSVHAVKDVNLQIRDKEFVVFRRAVGLRQDATLRMIAGLEAIMRATFRSTACRERSCADGPRHCDGVPELRALSAMSVYATWRSA